MSSTRPSSYLSDMLTCDPMRITKKFAGASCIGKQIFTPKGDVPPAEQDKFNRELNTLKDAFINRQHNKLNYLSRGTERTAATAIGHLSLLQANVAEKLASISANSKAAKERRTSYAYNDDDSMETALKAEAATLPRKILKAKPVKRAVSTPVLPQFVPRTVLSPIAGSVPIDHMLAMQQTKLKRNLKRAHSSLSVSECDNLVSDHDAANDLFMQFVSKVTHDIKVAVTNAEERLRNTSPTPRPKPVSLKLEGQPAPAPVSDHNQISPEGKMSATATFPPIIKVESESDDALTDLGSPSGHKGDAHAYITSRSSSSSGSPVGMDIDCVEEDDEEEDGTNSEGDLDSEGVKLFHHGSFGHGAVAYVE